VGAFFNNDVAWGENPTPALPEDGEGEGTSRAPSFRGARQREPGIQAVLLLTIRGKGWIPGSSLRLAPE
jgi:hypothetical protein